MTEFARFSKLLNTQFQMMSQHELFTVPGTGDDLWAAYLAAFPVGTNNIFRQRTEHDCSCCRNFIKNIGNVVAIIDGKQVSVWDVEGAEYPYNEVTNRMAYLLRAQSISGLYRTSEKTYGAEFNFERVEGSDPIKWNHYHGAIAAKHFTKEVGTIVGEFNTTAQVFQRGLAELTPDAFTTVIGLIEANNLYRGEEFLAGVKGFQKLQNQYLALAALREQRLFVWTHATDLATRFRNTAMGTLVQDLSEGVPLEAAVRSFEAKVAPTNYKRTTALITPAMINSAMAAIETLGLRAALDRRFAKLSDISVNNVLWVNSEVRGQMKDTLTTLLMDSVAVTDFTGPVEEISIADFMADVVPRAVSIEAMVKNTLANNFMSLTAPVHADSGKLFKWSNNFAWSYSGNITDSIKDKVKRAGGNTEAALRISLAWFNSDDLDIAVIPPNGRQIDFSDKQGYLDVDMNAWGQSSATEPVENVSFTHPRDGVYSVVVNQYNKRVNERVGFIIEVESNGVVTQYTHERPATRNQKVCDITVDAGVISAVILAPGLVSGSASKEQWGVNTEQFVKVNTLMYSPNHWDEQAIGNRHWFFMLDGCLNPEPTRGIYNEFLHNNLSEHRKVFEVLGDKTKCQPTAEQLSGIGFSSTRGDQLLVRVTGDKLRKSFNISF